MFFLKWRLQFPVQMLQLQIQNLVRDEECASLLCPAAIKHACVDEVRADDCGFDSILPRSYQLKGHRLGKPHGSKLACTIICVEKIGKIGDICTNLVVTLQGKPVLGISDISSLKSPCCNKSWAHAKITHRHQRNSQHHLRYPFPVKVYIFI